MSSKETLWEWSNSWLEHSLHKKITKQVKKSADSINYILSRESRIFEIIDQIEKIEKWFKANRETIKAFLEKYPELSVEEFEEYFLEWTYNKNLLMCQPDIVETLDLQDIIPWSDLIEILIDRIWLSQVEFEKRVLWKLDILTIPNFCTTDVAQWYFYRKLQEILKWVNIVFWDMPEIRELFWRNQLSCDSVWFIDPLWNWIFNSCLLKLLKTPPDEDKVRILDDIFGKIDRDIFVWWSTFKIPFELPEELFWVSLPKVPTTNNPPQLLPSGLIVNSMWYLNSAYYAKKTKWSFVSWSHNIAEPMHAWNLTVINDETENRHNHNWLISYFWERSWLLHYIEWRNEQEGVDRFLTLSKEELQKRFDEFKKLYEEKIIPLIYWILYNHLKRAFPELIK